MAFFITCRDLSPGFSVSVVFTHPRGWWKAGSLTGGLASFKEAASPKSTKSYSGGHVLCLSSLAELRTPQLHAKCGYVQKHAPVYPQRIPAGPIFTVIYLPYNAVPNADGAKSFRDGSVSLSHPLAANR